MSADLNNNNLNLNDNANFDASKIKKKGTKEEVHQGLAIQTGGGLRKEDLMLNKRGKVVSKKRHEHGKNQVKNIEKYISERRNKKENNEEENEEEKKNIIIPNEPIEQEEKDKNKLLDLKDKKEELIIKSNEANINQDLNKLNELRNNIQQIDNQIKLKEDAVQEEKKEEAPIKVIKKRGRKIKDMPPSIEEIKLNKI